MNLVIFNGITEGILDNQFSKLVDHSYVICKLAKILNCSNITDYNASIKTKISDKSELYYSLKEFYYYTFIYNKSLIIDLGLIVIDTEWINEVLLNEFINSCNKIIIYDINDSISKVLKVNIIKDKLLCIMTNNPRYVNKEYRTFYIPRIINPNIKVINKDKVIDSYLNDIQFSDLDILSKTKYYNCSTDSDELLFYYTGCIPNHLRVLSKKDLIKYIKSRYSLNEYINKLYEIKKIFLSNQ